MSTVIADMSMSLDGFIADPDDAVGPLFDWFENGPVAFEWPGIEGAAHVTEASAGHLRRILVEVGALVCGRRLYDHTNGWNGSHPAGVLVFVVSHTAPDTSPQGTTPLTFVTDGVESAIARAGEVAGDRAVVVASASIAQQCLDLGLLDVIQVSLAPVLLGEGIPWFGNLRHHPVMLENPEVIQGDRVTHLYYRVIKSR
ncbi:MAG TPA: dihydrofolate reductase family protein [Solirubrobacteraceae bacterium]